MHATERRAASLVGADVFARLYDLLATRAEAEEEGAHDDAEALGERVYAIVPREKAEAVALAYRYMYLVGRLEALGAAEEEDERGAVLRRRARWGKRPPRRWERSDEAQKTSRMRRNRADAHDETRRFLFWIGRA